MSCLFLIFNGRAFYSNVGKANSRRSTFTFMHLADAFIQSDLQCTQVIHILSVYVRHTSHNFTVVFSLFRVD